MSPPVALRLSPGREARLQLAVDAAWEARDGDPDEYRAAIERLLDLNERLFAEQLAELGCLPTTVEGCIAVLDVAARILELTGDRGGA